MLQFWKKPGQEKRPESFTSSTNSNETQLYNTRTTRGVEKYEFVQISEEILQSGDVERLKNKSSIVKSLPEVLQEKNVLNYFIQFMESRNSEAYILCWLDIETFKTDLPRCSPSPISTHTVEHDSLSVSTDSDSIVSSISSEFDDCRSSNLKKCSKNCDKGSDISISPKYLKNLDGNNIQVDKDHLASNALVIFKKYVAQEAALNIKCTDEIRKDLIENICDSSKLISIDCFEKVQSHVYTVMEKDYFEPFMSSDYYCKYQIDVLTSGNTVLDDILNNETALFYFMEYLEQEDERNLLEFWIAAKNFHYQLLNQGEFFDPIEAQNDAVVLYDKYFSLQAHCPLGLGDKVRLSIEQTICGENGVNLDCFNIAIVIVERLLEMFFIRPFLESQLFYKFLSELINTVQSNGYTTTIRGHKRSPSDADSEHSFASSTFLAMEINQNSGKKQSKATTNMTIDTRELYDPDTLWKQKRKSKLLCGYVTDLGRFETEFEPEPDRGEFKFKDVVKKFVSLEEEQKKKEEMAWQVAEMIVRDITNITLNNHC